MKKNVMLSLLAIASTSAAYADADLTAQIKTDAATAWSDDSNVTLSSGAITSPNGTAVSQDIGKLLPGKYQLTTGTNSGNIKLTINGKEYENGIFPLAEETEIVIKIESTDAQKYVVGGFKLTLVYDFDAVVKQLNFDLSEQINKIKNSANNNTTLLNEASAIGAEIKTIKDNDATSYDVYKKFKLYNGTGNTIANEIAALKIKVSSAADNATAYNKAIAEYNQQTDALKQVNDQLTNATTTAYSKNKYTDNYKAINAEINTFKENADKYYAEETAGTNLTDEVIKAFNTKLTKEISELGANITKANADDKAYNIVLPELNTVNKAYDDALQELIKALPGAPDVYGDKLEEVQALMKDVRISIAKAETANGTAENHDGAAAAQADNEAIIKDATANIQKYRDDYTTEAANLKTAYKNALQIVDKLTASLKNVDITGVATQFAETVTTINGTIDALKDKIEAANKDHSIGTADYSNDEAAIETAINDFSAKAAPKVANYKANESSLKAIADLSTKFEAAKKVVDGLSATGYKVAGRYAATEKKIQDQIATFTQGASDANAKGDAVSYFEKQNDVANVDGYAFWDGQIKKYQSNAENGFKKYQDAEAAIAKYTKELGDLNGVVKNPEVLCIKKNDTYASLMGAIQADITAIQTAVNEALKKEDQEHYQALVGININAGISTRISELSNNYSSDERTYNSTVTLNAATTMKDESTKSLVQVARKLAEDKRKYTAETVGKAFSDISKTLTDIGDKVTAQSALLGKIDPEKDPSAALASLSEINTVISGMMTDITAMEKTANVAIEKVTANNAKKTEADKAIIGLEVQLNGDGAKVTGVEDLNKDTNKTDAFKVAVSEIERKIQAQQNEITKQYKDENLVLAWADSKDSENKIVKGISSHLTEIGTSIEALRLKADSATNNWNAYQAELKYFNDVKFVDIITAAESAVRNNATGAAQTYFLNILSKDKAQATTDVIEQAYKDGTSVDKKAGIKAKIDTWKDAINAMGEKAKVNESAHNNLTGTSNAIQKNWNEVYNEISTKDQSTLIKKYLSDLAIQQTELNNQKDSIEAVFGKGACKTDSTKLMTELEKIQSAIKGIKDAQSEGYDAQISLDNYNRYFTQFRSAVDAAEAAYNTAITTIDNYTKIKNEDYRGSLEAAIKTNSTIYSYASKIIALKEKAKQEYEATTSPALYDANNTNIKTADTYTQEIYSSLNSYRQIFNDAAKIYFGKINGEKTELLSDSIATLQYKKAHVKTPYDQDVIDKQAFKDVRDLIKDAESKQSDANFAIELDDILTAYAKIETMLKDGYEPTAEAQWNAVISPIDTQIDKDLKTLSGYHDASSLETNYNDLVEKYITKAKKLASDAIGKKALKAALLEEIDGVSMIDLTTDFTTQATQFMSNAKAGNQPYSEENLAAYGKMSDAISSLQLQLDSAKTYAEDYSIMGVSSMPSEISSISDELSELKKKAQGFRDAGTASVTNNLDVIRTDSTAIHGEIANIYDSSDGMELARWTSYSLPQLKTKYNAAAVVLGSIDNKDLVQYKDSITNFDKEILILPTKKFANRADKHTAYLDFDKKMSGTLAAIVNLYNDKLLADVRDTLNNAIGVVEENRATEVAYLATCNKAVQTEFSDCLEILKVNIDQVKSLISERYASNVLLMSQEDIKGRIQILSDLLSTNTKEIKTKQQRFDVSDEIYVNLKADIQAMNDSLTSLKTIVGGYQYTKLETYKVSVDDIQKLIDADRTAVTTHSDKNDILPAGTTLSPNSKASIISRISALAMQAAYNETVPTIEHLNTILTNDVTSVLNASVYKFTGEVKAKLTNEASALSDSIWFVRNYNNEVFYHSGSNKDVYGGDIKDENGNLFFKSADYMSEALGIVNARILELQNSIAALKSETEANRYIKGDISGDGEILVDDYSSIRKAIVGTEPLIEGSVSFLAADINDDGRVNVGDVTALANLINKSQFAPTSALMSIESVSANDDNGTIELTSEIGENKIQRIAINLNSNKSYVACQMDIHLPAGMTIIGESLGGRANGHTLDANNLSDGTHRILICNLENNAFTNSENAILYLDVSSNKSANDISISNIMFTDAGAKIYNLSNVGTIATGINSATGSQGIGSKIYSVGGVLVNKIKKGINIIRNADGTSKKVLKR